MIRRQHSLALAAFAILAFAAIPAFAQEELDLPTVAVVGQKPSSVKLFVTAGSSGAPNGFAIDWMKKSEFELLGGWPADANGPMASSYFTGTPTFNTDGNAGAYQLQPGGTIEVELGQLFDETGVLSDYIEEMDPSTQYVVRVRALGGGGTSESVNTPTMTIVSGAPSTNCTYTIGYWKNHPEAWPVLSLQLGNVVYNQADLLAILGEQAQGNGLIILAHQLIAAKLNIQAGADPTAASAAIAAADAQIGNLICPPIGADYLDPLSVNSKVNTLDNYNNGIIGPGHCGTTPAASATWGSLKSIYRH
jgi:hypothetical protein